MKLLIVFLILSATSMPMAFSTSIDTLFVDTSGTAVLTHDTLFVRLGDLYNLRNRRRDLSTPKGRPWARITHYPTNNKLYKSSSKRFTTCGNGNLRRPLIVSPGDAIEFYSPKFKISAMVTLNKYAKPLKSLDVSTAKTQIDPKYLTGTIGGLEKTKPHCICVYRNKEVSFVRLDLLYRFVMEYDRSDTLYVKIDLQCASQNGSPAYKIMNHTGEEQGDQENGNNQEEKDDQEEDDDEESGFWTILSIGVVSDLQTEVDLDIIIDDGIKDLLEGRIRNLMNNPLND